MAAHKVNTLRRTSALPDSPDDALMCAKTKLYEVVWHVLGAPRTEGATS